MALHSALSTLLLLSLLATSAHSKACYVGRTATVPIGINIKPAKQLGFGSCLAVSVNVKLGLLSVDVAIFAGVPPLNEAGGAPPCEQATADLLKTVQALSALKGADVTVKASYCCVQELCTNPNAQIGKPPSPPYSNVLVNVGNASPPPPKTNLSPKLLSPSPPPLKKAAPPPPKRSPPPSPKMSVLLAPLLG